MLASFTPFTFRVFSEGAMKYHIITGRSEGREQRRGEKEEGETERGEKEGKGEKGDIVSVLTLQCGRVYRIDASTFCNFMSSYRLLLSA